MLRIGKQSAIARIQQIFMQNQQITVFHFQKCVDISRLQFYHICVGHSYLRFGSIDHKPQGAMICTINGGIPQLLSLVYISLFIIAGNVIPITLHTIYIDAHHISSRVGDNHIFHQIVIGNRMIRYQYKDKVLLSIGDHSAFAVLATDLRTAPRRIQRQIIINRPRCIRQGQGFIPVPSLKLMAIKAGCGQLRCFPISHIQGALRLTTVYHESNAVLTRN